MVPRLPIPNRTVKRTSADDSTDYPCESRTLPNTYLRHPPDGGCYALWKTTKRKYDGKKIQQKQNGNKMETNRDRSKGIGISKGESICWLGGYL